MMIRFLAWLGSLLFIGLFVVGALLLLGFWHYGRDLPEYGQLADYQPDVMTRVHAADGAVIAEFARQRRLFVPISAIPPRVVQAFLSAEDKTFYSHPGVDFLGIINAVATNVRNLGNDRRPIGASTITQQVAKNFLLTNEVSIERKIKEAILAFRIEHTFGKDLILELYLNEIYLGGGAYGVAAASLHYFDKSLADLTLSETAFLAALPKAPNNYHPIRRQQAAVDRRNWVLGQMLENGVITADEANSARQQPLLVAQSAPPVRPGAEYFAEEVRRQLVDQYGDEQLFKAGMSVRSTLNTELQEIARQALRQGLVDYDLRHGWRGPLDNLAGADRATETAALTQAQDLLVSAEWRTALVREVSKQAAEIEFGDGERGRIPLEHLAWAREPQAKQTLGAEITAADQVLATGDLIVVAGVEGAEEDSDVGIYALRQLPEANGAIVAIDPHTGRIHAMVGGYNYHESEFNRATQAWRQPGSAFKPFVYAAALDNGFTPSSLIMDAPFVIDRGDGQGKWKPSNYTRKFYGPSTLRLGIEKSRNLMTVRLAQHVGMDIVADYAERFGITEQMPPYLPMSLGAGETTLLRLTTAYAMLVNGGRRLQPTIIDRIQDRHGRTIFRHDKRSCPDCRDSRWQGVDEPFVPDVRPRVIEAATAYQVTSMLQGVIERGTGVRIRDVGKPLAGKTGTTNDSKDSWFVGFSPDLAVGVFVGFDTPRTLGSRETGSSVAAPIFRTFMAEALANTTAIPFRVPADIRLVRVDPLTGLPTRRNAAGTILEAFRPGTEPTGRQAVLDGDTEEVTDPTVPALEIQVPQTGLGGLY